MKKWLGSVAVGGLLLGASSMPSMALTCNGLCNQMSQLAINAFQTSSFGDSQTNAAGIFDQFGFTTAPAPPSAWLSDSNTITVFGGVITGATIGLYTAAGVLITGGTVSMGISGGNQVISLIDVPVLASQAVYLQITGTCANCSFAGTERLVAAPLPAALPLFAAGMGLLGFLGRRRKRTAV